MCTVFSDWLYAYLSYTLSPPPPPPSSSPLFFPSPLPLLLLFIRLYAIIVLLPFISY